MYKHENYSIGHKAEILRTLSEEEDFAGYIPPMVFIADTVFDDFLAHSTEIQEKIIQWFQYYNNKDYESAEEEYDNLKLCFKELYVPYLK